MTIMRKCRKLTAITILFLAVCLMAGTLTVAASEAGMGTVSVELRDGSNEKLVRGGRLALYKVADRIAGTAGESYQFTEAFADCGLNLNEFNPETLPGDLADYAGEHSIAASARKQNVTGTTVFDKLSPGLYLVIQDVPTEGYYPMNSFVVAVPMGGGNGSAPQYEITAKPKMQLIPPKGTEPDDSGKDPNKPGTITPTPSPTQPGNNSGTKPDDNFHTGSPDDGDFVKKPPMIQTGQLNWPVILFAVLGFTFIGIGLLFLFSGKEK